MIAVHRLASPMRFKLCNCKRLQGAAEAGRRACRRTFVLQVPDNKADAVPCERLPKRTVSWTYKSGKLSEKESQAVEKNCSHMR